MQIQIWSFQGLLTTNRMDRKMVGHSTKQRNNEINFFAEKDIS